VYKQHNGSCHGVSLGEDRSRSPECIGSTTKAYRASLVTAGSACCSVGYELGDVCQLHTARDLRLCAGTRLVTSQRSPARFEGRPCRIQIWRAVAGATGASETIPHTGGGESRVMKPCRLVREHKCFKRKVYRKQVALCAPSAADTLLTVTGRMCQHRDHNPTNRWLCVRRQQLTLSLHGMSTWVKNRAHTQARYWSAGGRVICGARTDARTHTHTHTHTHVTCPDKPSRLNTAKSLTAVGV
jgi:hypothetical protein